MNALTFQFNTQDIRTIVDEQGEPWFCAKDVCDVLDYSNTSKAISDHCREKGITKRYTLTEKGEQELTFINEGNLYRLIIKSQKPEAEPFETWVCDEVLPSIRKTGGYGQTQIIANLRDHLIVSSNCLAKILYFRQQQYPEGKIARLLNLSVRKVERENEKLEQCGLLASSNQQLALI
jgi:prophage antirepressor-like protein